MAPEFSNCGAVQTGQLVMCTQMLCITELFMTVLDLFVFLQNIWDLDTNIYICIAVSWDETSILVSVNFWMKNIYQSYDLVRSLGRINIDVSQ